MILSLGHQFRNEEMLVYRPKCKNIGRLRRTPAAMTVRQESVHLVNPAGGSRRPSQLAVLITKPRWEAMERRSSAIAIS